MKTNNKKKVVVSVLALAMGAGLAGSISGSVAWYQYSTRAAALINGTSAGTLGRLQIAQYAAEHQESDWKEKVQVEGQTFQPTTINRTSETGGDTLTFLKHPIYQVAQLPALGENEKPWVDLKFDFRFQKNTTNSSSNWAAPTNDSRNIYLSHFAIVSTSTGTGAKDVSSAVRVAFLTSDATKAKAVLAKTTSQVTQTKGNLDLNKNTNPDTMLWDCTDSDYTTEANKIVYSNNGTSTSSYTADAHTSWVLTPAELAAHPYDLDANYDAKAIGSVDQTLTIRIWLEGWDLLGGSTADWSADYIAQNFDIQLQFACEAEH